MITYDFGPDPQDEIAALRNEVERLRSATTKNPYLVHVEVHQAVLDDLRASEARVAVLEAALRECLGVIEILTITMESGRPGSLDLAARGAYEVAKHRGVEAVARRALARATGGGE